MPESFEWLVLSSGLIEGKDIENMLEEPETAKSILAGKGTLQKSL